MKKKEYEYLLSYGVSIKTGDKLQYTNCGTGRIVLKMNKKIKTQSDIIEVENILLSKIEIDNVSKIDLYSFSLLE